MLTTIIISVVLLALIALIGIGLLLRNIDDDDFNDDY